PYAFRAGAADSLREGGVTTSTIADGAITPSKLSPAGAATGQVLLFNGETVGWGSSGSGAGSGGGGEAAWSLTGNAGIDPTGQFLGTTDPAPLEFRVNGNRALRLEPTVSSPNLIGGAGGNRTAPGVIGATVSGGGSSDGGDSDANVAGGDYSAVGGGRG